MRKSMTFLGVVVLAAGMTLFVGCSDDDDGTGNNLIAGDLDDPVFEMAEDIVGEMQGDLLGNTMMSAFELWDSTTALKAVGRESITRRSLQGEDDMIITSWSYSYSSPWHIVTFAGYTSDGFSTTYISGVDSMQFLVNGDPTANPADQNIDGLVIHAGLDMVNEYEGFSATYYARVTVDNIGDLAVDPITLNGSTALEWEVFFVEGDAECSLTLSGTMAINDAVVLFGDDYCPSSGSLVSVETVDMVCVGNDAELMPDISGVWTVTLSWAEDYETITFVLGNTIWTDGWECPSGPSGD